LAISVVYGEKEVVPMLALTQLILQGLEAANVTESEDDRPIWQKNAFKIPFVKFCADIRRVSDEGFIRRIEEVFQSQGFKHTEHRRVEGTDIWHILIHHHAEYVQIIVSFSGDTVTVSSLPPGRES
jgi:hypothetical protein